MNPTEKRELMEMIRSLRDRFGMTILLIEHDMKVVMGVCERIIVLDYGHIIAQGTPEEIRKTPAVIQAYLGRFRLNLFFVDREQATRVRNAHQAQAALPKVMAEQPPLPLPLNRRQLREKMPGLVGVVKKHEPAVFDDPQMLIGPLGGSACGRHRRP